MIRLIAIILCSMFLGLSLQAQSKNIFLERSFWKTDPSIERIDQKIIEGNDVSELNGNAFDAVVYALLEGVNNNTIKYLLSKKGNGVNKITHDGRTYIFWAAYKSNIEIVQYLLDEGAKMDVVDSHGYTALNFAVSNGQLDTNLLDLLLTNGAKITDIDHNGADALLLSGPYLTDFSLINYFIGKGAKSSIKDADGNGLFNYAARGGKLEFLQLLIDNGYDYKTPNNHGGNAVMFATRGTRSSKNGIKTYEFLKEMGLQINVVGKGGKNPLHNLASREKDLDLLKYFIDNGVRPDLADEKGNTAYMWASRSNSLEVINLFSSYVNDVNHINEDGQSALTMAIARNSSRVCQFLIDRGADVDVVDKNGNSLAYYLINSYDSSRAEEFEAKFKLLQNNGFQLRNSEGKGQTLYHLSVENNDLDLIKRLKIYNLDINAKNENGLTALHVAAMKAHNQDIMKYLIAEGADKSILTDFDESVYDLAAENELLQMEKVDLSFLK